MKTWDDLVNYFHGIADQTAEQQDYNENPIGFAREKRADMKNMPQEESNAYLKDLESQRQAFNNAEGAIGFSGGVSRSVSPLRKQIGETFVKEGVEGLRDKANRLQEFLNVNESGISSLPEDVYESTIKAKDAIQERIADEVGRSERLKKLFGRD